MTAKPLQSVAKGDLQLDEIVAEDAATKQEEEKKDQEHQKEYDALLKKIKDDSG